MNDNFKNIVENNKEFMNNVYSLFIHFYNVESKRNPERLEASISVRILKELKDRNILNYIDNVGIKKLDEKKYSISISEFLDNQIWFFELNIQKINDIKLIRHIKILHSAMYSTSEHQENLHIGFEDLEKEEVILDLKNKYLSKEDIDLIYLKYDLDLSNVDLKNIFFKHMEILNFIRELK